MGQQSSGRREDAMPNDVGEWGEKDIGGAYATPLTIAGEAVDVDKLPAFGSGDAKGNAPVPAPVRK